MTPCYVEAIVGLGGNVGRSATIIDRFGAVRRALSFYGTVRCGAIYRTAPQGGVAQAPFLNTALAVSTEKLQPLELLALLQSLETSLGRDRANEERWGPRTIDLDILLYGARTLAIASSPFGALTVPHPRLAERRFALAPLVDLVGPDASVPGAGRVGDLLAAVTDQPVEEVAAFFVPPTS